MTGPKPWERKFHWTRQRRKFVEEYLRCWNAAEAARRAGYKEKWAAKLGHRQLQRPEIRAEIDRRLAAMALTTDEVLARLGEQARAEQAEYYENDGTIDLVRLLADGKGHLIKGTKWDRDGRLVIEFYDAQAALVHIGKHLGLFKDSLELTGKDGKPLFDLDAWQRERAERRQALDDLEEPTCADDDGES